MKINYSIKDWPEQPVTSFQATHFKHSDMKEFQVVRAGDSMYQVDALKALAVENIEKLENLDVEHIKVHWKEKHWFSGPTIYKVKRL